MNKITDMMNNIEINKLDDILINIINYDFNKLTELFIKNDTNICIECDPMYEYLNNNLVKRFNIQINDNDIQL